MKKGQTQQFNWIFVLIAGAFLLIMMIFFTVKYKDLQESRNNAEIVRGVDKIVSAISVTSQYNNVSVSFPFELRTSCDDFVVNNDQKLKFNDIVFAPSLINTNELFAWSEEIKIPFKAANIVYLIDAESKYYFDEDPFDLKSEFPNPIKDNIVNDENDADVLVYFNLNNIGTMQNKKVVYFNTLNSEYGNVEINNVGNEFMSKQLMLGAIFSADSNNYECALDKVKDKIDNVKSVYQGKIRDVIRTSCGTTYSSINQKLQSSSLDATSQSINQLKVLNEGLVDNGCRVVF